MPSSTPAPAPGPPPASPRQGRAPTPTTPRRGRAAAATTSPQGRAAAPAARPGRRGRVLLAEPRSFCAGVERAIEIVERVLERHGPPVYVRKEIVHNTHVVADLRSRGAVFVDELSEVPEGAVVVFSAHGVAPAVWEEAGRRRLDVVDATCPLVEKVHAEARRFARDGCDVVLIGHAGHEEVEGTSGEAPGAVRLVQTVDDVAQLTVRDPERVAYVSQTTLAVDEVDGIVDALRRRYPSLRGPGSEDICYATQNRQDAVRAIAREADLVLVVGSSNSSNSRRLAEVARREGCRAHLLEGVEQLDDAWLDGCATVGVTAGASAPEEAVQRLVAALAERLDAVVEARAVTEEDVRFALPREVR